ncbi:methyltransferase domain-containing protein [Pseudomonas tremae]|uniref:class I SAM-dependent methyltransferase n=1 Tax=Pseudomonas tremae TaxID=200454 RepID=UPI001F211561|nr:class I SAM-dependent methyltransferase [Pseudomonas tremae]MCF5711535.1 methyltransferase domain-containing protein [Pseudomonas tremae]UQB31213.1 methyltransferase domain-containing protein [Pseudomonas tremae]
MRVVDSSVLKKWYDSEYSACSSGTLFGELREELKRFLSNLPDGPGDVLELGCGDGRNLAALALKGYSLSGVDMVDSTVHSRQLNPWLKDMNFQQANILNYTPAPEGYDVLVCSEVLHFFTKDELQQVMPKIIGTVKPGGYIVLDLLSDLTRFFQATGEPFIWDKEAGLSIQDSEGFFDRWLSGFDIVDFSHFFDNQSWPLTDSVSLPIEPYTWQGTYVSVCAKKRK